MCLLCTQVKRTTVTLLNRHIIIAIECQCLSIQNAANQCFDRRNCYLVRWDGKVPRQRTQSLQGGRFTSCYQPTNLQHQNTNARFFLLSFSLPVFLLTCKFECHLSVTLYLCFSGSPSTLSVRAATIACSIPLRVSASVHSLYF